MLTFGVLSRDSSDSYLGEGLADAISARLGQLARMTVTSRTAVRRLSGVGMLPPVTLGRALSVAHLVSGTLLRTGGRLRVTIELVRAGTGTQVWSGQFVRDADDVLAIETEVAGTLAVRIAGPLTGAERAALGVRPTRVAEAYDLYLRGRFLFNQQTREGLERSLQLFDAAIARDSGFALAHVAVADTYFWLTDDFMSPREAYPKMKAAVDRALLIDSTLARAHTLLGAILLSYDWDRTAAEREFRRAIALDSTDATAHFYYAYLFGYASPAGLAEMELAQRFDPLNPMINSELVGSLKAAGRSADAIALAQHTIALDSTQFHAWETLGDTYLATGRTDDAIAAYQHLLALRWTRGEASLVEAYSRAGRRDDVTRALAELEARATREYVSPFLVAFAYAVAGDADRAFAWLDRALEDRSGWLIDLRNLPAFSSLHEDPRYAVLLRRITSEHR